MKIKNYKVVELTQLELIKTEGGDWLYDFGAACHRFFCGLGDSNYDPGYGQEGLVHGSGGLKY